MSTPTPQIKQEPTIEDEPAYQINNQNVAEMKSLQVFVKTEYPEMEIEGDSIATEISVKNEPRGSSESNSGDTDDSSQARSDTKDKSFPNPDRKRKRIRRKNKDDIVELIIDKDIYICGICKKTFRIRGYAIRHIENHKKTGEDEQNFEEQHQKYEKTIPLTKKENLWCQICDKYFKEYEYLAKHLRINKCKVREDLLCKTCNEQFDSYTLYKTHLVSHEPKKNQCEICSKVFKFKKQLQDHYKTVHNNPKPFKCDLCQKTFAKRTQLSGHLISHSDTRPYACKKCGKRFKHKQNVKKHLETHNKDVNLTCNLCQITFPRESRLRYHMRKHDKDRPFVCDLCQKSFSHKNNVLRHLMYKHPHTLDPVFVNEFKSKIRQWQEKRYYSKHVMESLKYCIYKGNKLGNISSDASVKNLESIAINQDLMSINPNATDIRQNGSSSDLISVKNELNNYNVSNVKIELEDTVNIKTEPNCIEPECILGAD